jgi:hypothetical protein
MLAAHKCSELNKGKPVVRQGRKARDLPDSGRADSPVAGAGADLISSRGLFVKANLARFSYTLVVLATLALSLGAGKRWF